MTPLDNVSDVQDVRVRFCALRTRSRRTPTPVVTSWPLRAYSESDDYVLSESKIVRLHESCASFSGVVQHARSGAPRPA